MNAHPLTTQFQMQCEMRMRAMELAEKVIDPNKDFYGWEHASREIYRKAIGEWPLALKEEAPHG